MISDFLQKFLDHLVNSKFKLSTLSWKNTVLEHLVWTELGEKNYDWVFNLGHGFLPDIDYKKVKYVVEWVKETNWNR